MGVSIYKIDKETLATIDSVKLIVANVSGLIIPHLFDGTVSNSSTLPFTIEIASGHVPYIGSEEFMIVIRDVVDATAIGPNDIEITSVGEDMGKDHKNGAPSRPWTLPNGFKELRSNDELL